MIDEAQSLPHELLEEVRLLANFETATEKLLPVVLAGQPELAARLEHEELRQLKQRVALRCDLAALDIRETAAYISGRVAIAGGDSARIFTREAVQTIYERSRGIPRTISVICDNALLTGFAAGVKPVGIEPGPRGLPRLPAAAVQARRAEADARAGRRARCRRWPAVRAPRRRRGNGHRRGAERVKQRAEPAAAARAGRRTRDEAAGGGAAARLAAGSHPAMFSLLHEEEALLAFLTWMRLCFDL